MPDFLGRERVDGRRHGPDELRRDAGVDGVGLGEPARGLGEVAGPFGLDDGHLELGGFEGDRGGEFEAAGRFDDGADLGGDGREGPEEVGEPAVAGGCCRSGRPGPRAGRRRRCALEADRDAAGQVRRPLKRIR